MINHEILRMPTCWRKFIRQPSPALATSNPTAFAAWKPKVKPQPCMTADCNRTCQDGPKTWLSLLENLWTKIGISTNQRQAYHNDSTSNFQICLKSCLKSLWMYKHIHKYCICIYIYICVCMYVYIHSWCHTYWTAQIFYNTCHTQLRETWLVTATWPCSIAPATSSTRSPLT